jgi:hypothetical protein
MSSVSEREVEKPVTLREEEVEVERRHRPHRDDLHANRVRQPLRRRRL